MTTDDDDLLFHYTDAGGLLGILTPAHIDKSWQHEIDLTRSLTLRASDVRYLNDATEIRYGAEIVVKILREKCKQTGMSATKARAMTQLADELANDAIEIDWGTHRSHLSVHAACFTESGDLLSQWQGYGDDGGGYAIGVTRQALEHAHMTLPNNSLLKAAQLVRVVYGDGDATHRLVGGLLDGLLHGGDALDRDGELTDIAREKTLLTAAQVKNPAFKSESEWRLISHTSGYWFNEFRANSMGLVPYVNYVINPIPLTTPLKPIDLEFEDGPAPRPNTIGKIVVGPGGDRTLRIDAVRRLLLRYGHNPDVVVSSDVPYRP